MNVGLRLAITCAGILMATIGFAQNTERTAGLGPALTIEQAMTAGELKETGIGGLPPSQRAAFDRWLNRWTAVVMSVSCGGSYGNTEEKLAIRENADGVILILEDGSIWMVDSVDRVDSSLWLATEDVIVIEARQKVGDYRYTLINADQKEKVLARYVGQE